MPDSNRSSQAEKAGYVPLYICAEEPGVGTMGQHYVNFALVGDPAIDPLRPEALVYEPRPDGSFKLVALEWVRVGPEEATAPTVLGQDLLYREAPNRYGIEPGFYERHYWLYKANPTGAFEDWIRRCPAREPATTAADRREAFIGTVHPRGPRVGRAGHNSPHDRTVRLRPFHRLASTLRPPTRTGRLAARRVRRHARPGRQGAAIRALAGRCWRRRRAAPPDPLGCRREQRGVPARRVPPVHLGASGPRREEGRQTRRRRAARGAVAPAGEWR